MPTMSRRMFGYCSVASFIYTNRSAHAANSTAAFDNLFAQVGKDEARLEGARSYREIGYRESGPSEEELAAAPNIPRKYRSSKEVSSRARALIVKFEVSGKKKYDSSYRKPVWPKGNSGVTIGIGYDLGYSGRTRFQEDWADILSNNAIEVLGPACGVTGPSANSLLPFFSEVEISWDAALQQFGRFMPFVGGETLNAFPKAKLLSSDSFGALVSLVYNRGSAMNSRGDDKLDRRREMRSIRDLIDGEEFSGVPDQMRSMKRLWENDPDAKGLLDRRELEARLFEAGMA